MAFKRFVMLFCVVVLIGCAGPQKQDAWEDRIQEAPVEQVVKFEKDSIQNPNGGTVTITVTFSADGSVGGTSGVAGEQKAEVKADVKASAEVKPKGD